ncbi:MAG: UbiA family prenyltransferase [Saprospiraceae bacterium]
MYIFSITRNKIAIDYSYAVFIFFSTLFTYSIHRIVGMDKVKAFAHKGRYAVIERFKWHIITYGLISCIVLLFLFFQFTISRQQLIIGSGIISILYVLPLFTNKKRLRDISFIKIFLVAIIWSFVTESIPLYESGISTLEIILLFLERVFFFIAITIPFDIRDIKVDHTNNVKTLPSLLGAKNAINLSSLLLVFAILLEAYIYFKFKLFFNGTIALICTYLISIGLINRYSKKENDYYFSGIFDGLILLPYLLLLLCNFILK